MSNRLLLLFFLLPSIASFSQEDSSHVNDNQSDTLQNKFNIPIFSTNGGDAESELDQQDASSLLQSSKDVFTQFASYQFGAARYRLRGYAAENQQVMINGVNVNNLETGYSSWSNWGGLNDVTRYVETRIGVVSNRYGFSSPGGYTNIDSRASSFKKGTHASYARGNRIYANRFMLTHSTGLLRSGWALTFSASNRSGNEVYIPGTYFNGSSYYLSVDKKLKDKHLFSFTGFVAPIEQGRTRVHRLEAYELAGSNYYNSFWGYQNGKVRNSSVSRSERPVVMMSYMNQINSSSRLTTTLFYTFGKAGLTRINWTNNNPDRDFWRRMPSTYYETGDTATGNYYKNKWLTDVNFRQIDWDGMIASNQRNPFVLPSQLGQGIVTNEHRARYIVENQIENLKNLGFNTVYNARKKNNFYSAGLNANIYRNRKYKEVEDLLGANYWLDYDVFADYVGADPYVQQNNVEAIDKKIYKGDRFGYDYSINVNRLEAWSQVESSFEKVDVYGSLSLSNSLIWRQGYVANGKFPANSKGLSSMSNFLNYGIKGGATFKITGRHSITTNASYLTRPPEVNSIFIAQQVRNDLVNNVGSEKLLSADANYMVKYPDLKIRLTAYYTQINNQTWVRSYYHDSYNTFVNLVMKGLNQTNSGFELGVEKTLFSSHTIQSAMGYGHYVYSNRPTLEAWQNNNRAELYTNRKVYLKNYLVGGTPQLVAGLGYKYNGKKFWFAGIYFNYFDHIYVEPNPERRTAEELVKYVSNESEVYNEIIQQERLPSYITLNFNGGKSFRLMGKYYLRINASVNNLLNNTHIITNGVENLRWDPARLERFDNRYSYMLGATYLIILSLNL